MSEYFLRADYYGMAKPPHFGLVAWEHHITSLRDRVMAGEPVYVKFREKRREGSIARITKLTLSKKMYHATYGFRSISGSLRPGGVEISTVDEVEVGWDDRKTRLTPSEWELTHVPDHDPNVGTVYVWTQTVVPKEPPKIVYDRIGEPVNAGDFVSFVHKQYGRISLKFGTITRITGKGTVFVQTLKLKDGDRSEEVRCNEDNVVIVNDQLMKRLVMAKLAAN